MEKFRRSTIALLKGKAAVGESGSSCIGDSLGICLARGSFKDMPACGAGETGRNLL